MSEEMGERALLIDAILDDKGDGWARKSSPCDAAFIEIFAGKTLPEREAILRRTAPAACQYRAELNGKSLDDLRALWAPIRDRRQRATREREEKARATEKAERYQKWAKLPFWSEDEAVSLVTGNFPDVDGAPYYNSKEQEDLSDLISRAISAKELPARKLPPGKLLAYLRAKKVAVPPGLAVAVEGLLPAPKPSAPVPQAPAGPLDSSYSSPWLEVARGAIEEFYAPRRNPDAKSEEVIAWIVNKAKESGIALPGSTAKTLFTILKPVDHDPKNKREA